MTIDEFYSTNAGAHIFNGVTRANLVDGNGKHLYFSKRVEITKHIIGLLLEVGYTPKETT